MSIPRSSTIPCTHVGLRPMPLQDWSGSCGSRYFAGLVRRVLEAVPPRATLPTGPWSSFATPAQRIADRIDSLIRDGMPAGASA